ncbi:sulfotransferase [Oceanicella actignis]|uniref:sulfotransferase n=1 Tax=Oceanicella actignis TaxID=1189325 RepID=UPI0011E7BCCE|nr:sulfotransferase [Oceanicella actignis]TYO91290.1 sulfotransferase family protein [Oceanicella actignis]
MGPDFICIGGQRCGTTWLYHALRCAPGIWTPPVKELHHFDVGAQGVEVWPYRYRRHLRSRAAHYAGRLAGRRDAIVDPLWDARYFLGRRSDDWYAGLFARARARGQVAGEITPAYSILPEATVARVAARFPDAKILLILRDPLARAWSNAMREPGLDPRDEQAVIAHLRSPGCVARSDWPAIVARWRRHFPRSRMLLAAFEQIREDRRAFLARIGAFLGASIPDPGVERDRRKTGASTWRRGPPPAHVVEAVRDIYDPIAEASAELMREARAEVRIKP